VTRPDAVPVGSIPEPSPAPVVEGPDELDVAGPPGGAPVDREAALRAGSTPIPRTFLLWVIAAFAVLGIGGLIAERLVGNAGVETVITTPPATLAGTAPAAPQTPTGPSVPASPAALIGLQHLAGARAPAIALHATSGAPWALAGARGKVVVLSFVNAECNDICPVLAAEITRADQLLGSKSNRVEFAMVNTDPLEMSLAVVPPALTQTGLDHLANVTFLTGSLPELSQVWTRYGIAVAVANATRVVSHNDLMYFITPDGRSALRATPFANESPLGAYSLDPVTVRTFARGVAAAAAALVGGAS
jgi:cytochrome oxidase Cu insertion factor (SCO1/SenC/PrrC family)